MTHSAQAAVFRTAGAAPRIETVEIDDPRPGEVLVQVAACGVCHTDMVMRDGLLPIPLPVVLGHEGSGYVVAVGDGVDHLRPGDAVVLSFTSCGACPSCDHHAPAYCHEWVPRNFFARRGDGSSALNQDGAAIGGHIFGQSSFATLAIADARNAVPVDPDLPIALLGPLGCGVQTGAGAIEVALGVEAGEGLAVIGTGAVGLSAIMMAAALGASPIVAIDRVADRVDLARALGATHGIVADGRPIDTLMAEAGIAMVDHVLDTTGIPALVEQGMRALAPRGSLGVLGAFAPGAQLSFDATHLMAAGRRVVGIVEGGVDPQRYIPRLIGLWREGRFPFDRLIETFPFERIVEAIAAGEEGRVVKPVVVMA